MAVITTERIPPSSRFEVGREYMMPHFPPVVCKKPQGRVDELLAPDGTRALLTCSRCLERVVATYRKGEVGYQRYTPFLEL